MKKENTSLVIFTAFPLHKYGGFEKFIVEVANGLTRSNQNLNITVLTLNDSAVVKYARIKRAFRLKVSDNLFLLTPSQSRNLLDERINFIQTNSITKMRSIVMNSDVLLIKNEIVESFLIKLVGYKNLPSKVTITVATSMVSRGDSFLVAARNYIYRSGYYKKYLNIANSYHAWNSEDKKSIEKITGSSKVYVVPGIYRHKAVKKTKQNSGSFKKENKMIIGWAARVTIEKGVDRLSEIISSVNNSHRNVVEWRIYGDGADAEVVKELADKFSNVNYYGFVPNDELLKELRYIDLFLCTSRFETFGISVLEAQLAGSPVFSYNISGPRDIISRDTGEFVEDTDEMISKVNKYIKSNTKYKKENIIKITEAKFDFDVSMNKLSKALLD